MALWRAEALERLPELRKEIAAAKTIMSAWTEILLAFERAYERNPRDKSFISRVYSFADWCVEARRNSDPGRDPLTAAVVCFYEHIPTCPAARDDIPRWFRFEEIIESKEIFGYMIDKEELNKLLGYTQRNRHRYEERAKPAATSGGKMLRFIGR